jgi:hypothetical protein
MTKMSRSCFAVLCLLLPLLPQAQELSIYRLSFYGYGDGREVRFIPLTDGFPWSEHPDSLSVADKYLGDASLETDHFHVMDKTYRGRFLNRLNIEETDNIYVYHFKLDSVFVLPVADVPLIAFVNPYGTYQPIPQTDYMIGFDINETVLPSEVIGKYYSNTYVYVGPGNPFVTGKIERMEWTETDSADFPKVEVQKNLQNVIGRFTPVDYYEYSSGDFMYYIKNLGIENSVGARQLVVVDKRDQQIELNQLFFGSEGADLLPLNDIEENHGYDGFQYTGQLFRFKPRIVIGFYDVSFGCTGIYFVSPEETPIYIRCDNRH